MGDVPYAGFYALVWFGPDMVPCKRKVYCDGRSWYVIDMGKRKLMRLDDASGYVLILGGDDGKAA